MGGILLKVKTYSGYRADERPVSFTLRDRTFRIKKLIDRWYGEDHAYFRVIADDGIDYTIRHDFGAGRVGDGDDGSRQARVIAPSRQSREGAIALDNQTG